MISWIVAASFFAQTQFTVPPPPFQMPTPGTVVARVNGKVITAAEVNKLLWDWGAGAVVEELIWMAMIEDAATKQNVTVTPQEIAALVETTVAPVRKSLLPGEDLDLELHQKGSSLHRIGLEAKMQLLVKKILLKDFKPAELRKLSRIVLQPKTKDAAGEAEAKKRAEDAVARLKKGEPWNTVALITDDVQTRARFGSINWVQIKNFPEMIRPAIARLKNPGDFTDALANDGSFVILKLDDAGPPKPEEVERIKNQVVAYKSQKFYEDLQKNSKIERNVYRKG